MPKTNEGTAANADLTKDTNVATMTQEQFDAEMARKKLELAELEIIYKKADLEDLRDRLAERAMRREIVGQRSRTNGQTLLDAARKRKLVQSRCNHRKGGNGAEGLIGGQGDDSQYCVMKHKMANSDWWIRCLRCGKWWVPPSAEDFETSAGYQGALAEYQTALNFPTRNSPSTSITFQWGDGGEFYRKLMKPSPNL